jgi:hypothetical protein
MRGTFREARARSCRNTFYKSGEHKRRSGEIDGRDHAIGQFAKADMEGFDKLVSLPIAAKMKARPRR